MWALKILAVAAVSASAIFAVDRWAWVPYEFNNEKRAIEADTVRAFDAPNRPTAAIVARDNLQRLRSFAERGAAGLDLYMYVAVNDRTLGLYPEAIEAYKKALTFDHRPEIYFNLGMTFIDQGNREDGIRNLVTALRFNPEAGYIGDPSISAEVTHRINAVQRPAN